MKPNTTKRLIAAGALLCSAKLLSISSLHAAVIDFESVPLGAPDGLAGYNNGMSGRGNLSIDGAGFRNSFTTFSGGFTSWSGFAFSNLTDTVTSGFGNQYSTFAGVGAAGSSQFALGTTNAAITFSPVDLTGTGAMITNTTYAALSMQRGDSFAKKFGGASGNDADFFQLIVSGYTGGIASGRKVEFFLADYRFGDNSQDYILKDWTYVDFSALGVADEIRFSFGSSDTGRFGINTPRYFAIDNLTAVPEPSALALGALGCLTLCCLRRRSKA